MDDGRNGSGRDDARSGARPRDTASKDATQVADGVPAALTGRRRWQPQARRDFTLASAACDTDTQVIGFETTPARPLATQPPTGLVDGDVVALLPAPPRGRGRKYGSHGCTAAPQHDDTFPRRLRPRRMLIQNRMRQAAPTVVTDWLLAMPLTRMLVASGVPA